MMIFNNTYYNQLKLRLKLFLLEERHAYSLS
jgi:hypothetical protein